MITTYINSNYRITYEGVSMVENALGNPNLVQISVTSGCTIVVPGSDENKKFGIDYLPNGEARSWKLNGLNTRINKKEAHFIFARLGRNEESALLVFSTNDYRIDGSVVSGETEIMPASDSFFYIKVGSITATDAVGESATLDREITYDGGYYRTDSYNGKTADLFTVFYGTGPDQDKIHHLAPKYPFSHLEIFDHLNIGEAWLKYDSENKALYVEGKDGEPVGFYSKGFISAKGVNPGTGTGGGSGDESGATTLGELNNVGSWADEIPSADRIMVQLAGATHWTSKPLSELVGLDEDKLAEYLAQNSYATQTWVTEKLGGYATTASLKTVSDKLDDFLTGTDTDNIINKWKELEAFLAGFHETDTLAGALSLKADKAITISAGTGLSGGGDLSANRTLSLKTATATALGGIKVGNRLSIDDNGVLSAIYTYTLPTASDTVLGGIKVGGTLDIASSILNLKATGTAGTYFKVTTDAYGRVTSGSNPTTLSGFGITDAKIANGVITLGTNTITPLTSASSLAWGKITGTPTTLVGYGITDGVNNAPVTGTGNAVTSVSLSGHTLTFTKGATFLTKAAFDDLFEKVNIGTASAPVYAIRAKYGLYSDEFLSVKGIAPGTGGGGGGSEYLHDLLDVNLSSPANGQVLSYDSASQKWVNKSIQQGLDTSAMWAALAGVDATKKIDASHLPALTKSQVEAVLTGDITSHTHNRYYDSTLSRTANTVLAAPSGSTGFATFRKLVAADIPALGYVTELNTSGNFLTWTKNGATNNITVPYASASHCINVSMITDLNAPVWAYDNGYGISFNEYNNSAANRPITNIDNANGLINVSLSKHGTSGVYGWQINLSGISDTFQIRRWTAGTKTNWFHLLHSGNYNSYAPSKTGTGASGTWGISITGNAATATKLGTDTVGGTAKGMYLNAGVPTAMSATAGSASRPVYLSGGTVTQCSYAFGNASGNAALNNGTVNTNLNADMLDGVHAKHLMEREYAGRSDSGTSTGWFRIAQSFDTLADNLGISGLLFLNRSYNYLNNESYTFSINIAYAGAITITQLSGVYNYNLIDKIRVTGSSSGKYYIDLHIASATTNNSYYWTTVGGFKSLDSWTSNPSAGGNTKEFSIMQGAKTDSLKDTIAYQLGSTVRLNASSTNPYLRLTQGSDWYIQGNNNSLYLGAGTGNSIKIDSTGNLIFPTKSTNRIVFNNDTTGTSEIHYNGSRVCIGRQVACGLNAGSILVSNSWADYAKVPTNGIYSKGNILSEGTLKALAVISSNYVDIGSIRLSYDSMNNAIKVAKTDGTAANLYTTGALSAKDIASGSVGSSDGIASYAAAVIDPDHHTSTTRRTSCNVNFNNDTGLHTFLATSSMTTGKPTNDSHIIHLEWDNQLSWAAQLAIPSNPDNFMEWRAQKQTTWSSWRKILDNYNNSTSSDIRLKNIVRNINLSVSDIARAPIFQYTWNNGIKGNMVGTSAQYWEKVLPWAVTKDKEGYLSMYYGHAAMVGVVSLARGVETLEQRAERLEKRITSLESENERLRKEIQMLKAA